MEAFPKWKSGSFWEECLKGHQATSKRSQKVNSQHAGQEKPVKVHKEVKKVSPSFDQALQNTVTWVTCICTYIYIYCIIHMLYVCTHH